MNKVIMMGRLTRDPEVRYSQGQNPTAVARFSIAVDRRFKREGEPDAKYTAGPASSEAPLRVAMEWFGTKPNEMLDRDLDAIFYTAAFADDYGGDGDIATFYIQIPEDAESGDEYDVDFYYYSTDTFKGMDGDRSFEKYAFSNWEGGKITVK